MRKTAADTKKTKIAILDAGIRIFARNGFEKAALEEIGKEAGLTRGAIYWHFKNKHDLFAQILAREDDLLDALVASALNTKIAPFDKLRRLLTAVIDNFYDNETFRQYIEFTWYKLGPSHFTPVMEDKTTFVQNFLVIMQHLLQESQNAATIRPEIDTHLAAIHLSCLINGLYRLYHVAPDWARSKRQAKALFADYLKSLTVASAARKPRPSTHKEIP